MTSTPTRRLIVPAMLVAALALQVAVLYAPEAPGPPSPIPHGDKAVHALVFALPVLVAGLGRRGWWPLVALLCALHAPVSEIIQHVVLPHRSGDSGDVAADLAGVGAASIGVLLVVRRPRRRRL
ncbi:VanZ family protein [Janibacter sp. G349]|uniref:VanZ family protein n=1 Tax=Janibacter sp. G349 TaxID=3405424 RepID=UPI003B82545C